MRNKRPHSECCRKFDKLPRDGKPLLEQNRRQQRPPSQVLPRHPPPGELLRLRVNSALTPAEEQTQDHHPFTPPNSSKPYVAKRILQCANSHCSYVFLPVVHFFPFVNFLLIPHMLICELALSSLFFYLHHLYSTCFQKDCK